MPDSAVLQERIFDASVSVERIVHLGVQLATEYMEDDLIEWLLEDASDVLVSALGVTEADWTEALNEYGTRRYEKQECLQEMLRPLNGWLVTVSVPKIDWSEDGKSGSVHMGWRTMHTAYADTYDEALEAALTWGEAFTSPPEWRAFPRNREGRDG